MKLTAKQHEAIYEELLDYFLDAIATDPSYIYDVVRNGFKGLRSYTEEELVTEYKLIFEEDPIGEVDPRK